MSAQKLQNEELVNLFFEPTKEEIEHMINTDLEVKKKEIELIADRSLTKEERSA